MTSTWKKPPAATPSQWAVRKSFHDGSCSAREPGPRSCRRARVDGAPAGREAQVVQDVAQPGAAEAWVLSDEAEQKRCEVLTFAGPTERFGRVLGRGEVAIPTGNRVGSHQRRVRREQGATQCLPSLREPLALTLRVARLTVSELLAKGRGLPPPAPRSRQSSSRGPPPVAPPFIGRAWVGPSHRPVARPASIGQTGHRQEVFQNADPKRTNGDRRRRNAALRA